MKYAGEHLFPGQLGHFLVLLSFVSSLVAAIAYYRSAQSPDLAQALSWRKLARIAFGFDFVASVSVFLVIYFLISGHYFEYFYAWNHSDKSLNAGYLVASIWEGQEGSFLLWTIWHGVLGLILMRTAKRWEAPVMTVISLAQFCLASMLVGIYVFDIKIGSNPFILTREFYSDLKGFTADYMSSPGMQDGNGLHQLLQNYWMVIHPPVLFLGFASTIVPFAYAIAGLWKKDYSGWIKDLFPWSLFSAAILGTGIMMGAMWAYESLTFGGFWAWDPVENASLVPWLIIVAGLHTQLIYNSTGHSLRPTFFFFIAGFVLILYSTYLTRSGDLADTSVHAFTNLGLNWQLRIFFLIFSILSLTLYVKRYKHIPTIHKEENSYSREFWMFIGSLILFLSATFITIFTSLPIINKLFHTNYDIGEEREFFYNRIQIFVVIVLGILTAITQYLRYKTTDKKAFGKKILLPTVIAVLIAASISVFGNIDYNRFGIGYLAAIHLALFTCVYAIVANAGYIWAGLNGKLKAAGASVGHMGFAILMVGALISSSKQKVLSINTVNPLNFGAESKQRGTENLTLFQGVRTDMGSYWATYKTDSLDGHEKITYFQVAMEKKKNGEKFTLYPNLIKNTKGDQNFSQNPDTKHYWNRDIFTFVNYADVLNGGEDTAKFRSYAVKPGDTIFYSNGYILLDKVVANPTNDKYSFGAGDTAIMAELSVVSADGRRSSATPLFYVRNNQVRREMDTVLSQGLAIGLANVVDNKHIAIVVKESTRLTPFIALKIIEFPFINLVWIGTVLMVTGLVMSMVRRAKMIKSKSV